MVFLTPTKMGRAIEMRKQGNSLRKIGEELKVSHEAVRLRLQAAAVRGDLYPRSPPGPPKLHIRITRAIYRDILLHPYHTFRQIAKDHGVGPKRVRNIAASHFLYRFISRKKPFLTAKARQNRRLWIKKAMKADFSAMIWTDESMVRIGDRGRR